MAIKGSKACGHLMGLEAKDLSFPDYVSISHAVCAMERDACGWQGWLMEGAFEIIDEVYNSGTGDRPVPAVTNQICPNSGRQLFRTVQASKYRRSEGPVEDLIYPYAVAD